MSLLTQHDALLLDLDGVVYRGPQAVPHAIAALNAASARGIRLGYVTNNAARPPVEVVAHLRELGLTPDEADVVTSAQVGADLLAERLPAGSPVMAVGGPGVAIALGNSGFEVVQPGEGSVAGVLQGYGPAVCWNDLAEASYAVAGGAAWVATNTDLTIPRDGGIAPGNGTLVAAVTAATGVVPPAAGKPAPAMMTIAARRLNSERPLVIGDRLDTDIAGAVGAGMPSLLVLTGVSSVIDVLSADEDHRPTYLAADLRGLDQDLADLGKSTDPIALVFQDAWAGRISTERAVATLIDLGVGR